MNDPLQKPPVEGSVPLESDRPAKTRRLRNPWSDGLSMLISLMILFRTRDVLRPHWVTGKRLESHSCFTLPFI